MYGLVTEHATERTTSLSAITMVVTAAGTLVFRTVCSRAKLLNPASSNAAPSTGMNVSNRTQAAPSAHITVPVSAKKDASSPSSKKERYCRRSVACFTTVRPWTGQWETCEPSISTAARIRSTMWSTTKTSRSCTFQAADSCRTSVLYGRAAPTRCAMISTQKHAPMKY